MIIKLKEDFKYKYFQEILTWFEEPKKKSNLKGLNKFFKFSDLENLKDDDDIRLNVYRQLERMDGLQDTIPLRIQVRLIVEQLLFQCEQNPEQSFFKIKEETECQTMISL